MKSSNLLVFNLEPEDAEGGYYCTWCLRCKMECYAYANSLETAIAIFHGWGWRRIMTEEPQGASTRRLCPECVKDLTGIEPNPEE